MWNLVTRRYSVVNLYLSHQLMIQIENVVLPHQTAVEFIGDIQRLREEYKTVAQDHSEAYWTSAVLFKLQTRYKADGEELMHHSEYTLEDIHTFFVERVYETMVTPWPNRNYKELVCNSSTFNQQLPCNSNTVYSTNIDIPTSHSTTDTTTNVQNKSTDL